MAPQPTAWTARCGPGWAANRESWAAPAADDRQANNAAAAPVTVVTVAAAELVTRTTARSTTAVTLELPPERLG